jgi:hypothetical protein
MVNVCITDLVVGGGEEGIIDIIDCLKGFQFGFKIEN